MAGKHFGRKILRPLQTSLAEKEWTECVLHRLRRSPLPILYAEPLRLSNATGMPSFAASVRLYDVNEVAA